jgi:hypothetical protein
MEEIEFRIVVHRPRMLDEYWMQLVRLRLRLMKRRLKLLVARILFLCINTVDKNRR